MRLRSLRFRLLGTAAISISIALALAGLALVLLFEHHVERRLDGEMETLLRQLIGHVEIDSEDRVHIEGELGDPRFAEPLSGLYWQVQDDAQHTLLRSASLWDNVLALPADTLAPGVVHRHSLAGPKHASLLVLERQVILLPHTDSRRLRVAIALDRAELASARNAFGIDVLPYLSVLAVILIAATWLQVDTGLAPLDAVRRGVLAIRSGRAQRLGGRFPDEVQPLIEEINELLIARDQAIERARAWTADLAHGLKTPLAALAGDAQRLRQQGHAEIAADLEQLTDQMRRRVDRELIRARLRSDGKRPGKSADLSKVVNSVVATLQKTPLGEAHTWQTDVPTVAVAIARDDLIELLGNLLDNACKWAREKVCITGTLGERVTITIDDDGPGVVAAQRLRLGERGLRLDEQIAGNGLGLAIVRDIVDAYGGEIVFARSTLGGLAVRLTLPAAGE